MNEEEKKIIEKFVEKCNKFDESVEIKGVSVGEEYRILETVCKTLDLVEKLQKENEELRKKLNEENKRCMMLAIEKQDYFEKYRYHLQQNESLTKEFSNVIPVQKVKDEIDRIDYDIKKTKEIISNNWNIYTSDRRNAYQIVRLRAMNTKSLDIKKRLQELIEESEGK